MHFFNLVMGLGLVLTNKGNGFKGVGLNPNEQIPLFVCLFLLLWSVCLINCWIGAACLSGIPYVLGHIYTVRYRLVLTTSSDKSKYFINKVVKLNWSYSIVMKQPWKECGVVEFQITLYYVHIVFFTFSWKMSCCVGKIHQDLGYGEPFQNQLDSLQNTLLSSWNQGCFSPKYFRDLSYQDCETVLSCHRNISGTTKGFKIKKPCF